MSTDWKALCAELSDAYLRALEHINDGAWLGYEPSDDPLITRARTALAQPEPVGPTNEELRDLWSWAGEQDQGPHPTQQHCFARAVLARWGQRAPQPIPVSERLPGAKDCDAQGRCWWAANDGIYHHWRKLDLEKALNSPWRPTHWLPAHALPLPQEPEPPK